MSCDSDSQKAPIRALTNAVNVSTTSTGGSGGESGQVKVEAVVEVSTGWYVVSVELYSREGSDPPVWLESMYFENTNSSGHEVYTAFAYEDGTGQSPSYVVEVELMRYQTEIVSGST